MVINVVDAAKVAGKLICGCGTSYILNGIIKNNCRPKNKWESVCVAGASIAIGDLIGSKVIEYVEDSITLIAGSIQNSVTQIRKAADEIKEKNDVKE